LRDISGDSDAEVRARDIWNNEQGTQFEFGALPLVRFVLLKLWEGEHWLIYTAHAIVLDGLSWNIFFKELGELYASYTRGNDPLLLRRPAPQYGDYAVWQRETFRPGNSQYQDALLWWTNEILTASYPTRPKYRQALLSCMKRVGPGRRLLKQIVGFMLRSVFLLPRPPRADLPYRRTNPVGGIDPGEGTIYWGVAPEVSSRLDALRRQERASDYVVRLAAYVAMLSMETRDENVSVYLSLSNRSRGVTRDVLGCCATSAILQLRCDGDATFRQLLVSVKDRLRAMHLHADVPYDRIHREMRAWRIKMPQGRAVLSTAWAHPMIRCGDIEIACLPDRTMTAPPLQFDTKFDLENEAENCSVLFDARRYDPEKVRGFVARFKRLLDHVTRTPDAPVRDVFASIKVAQPPDQP
jgi:condensation domain-containing protein